MKALDHSEFNLKRYIKPLKPDPQSRSSGPCTKEKFSLKKKAEGGYRVRGEDGAGGRVRCLCLRS